MQLVNEGQIKDIDISTKDEQICVVIQLGEMFVHLSFKNETSLHDCGCTQVAINKGRESTDKLSPKEFTTRENDKVYDLDEKLLNARRQRTVIITKKQEMDNQRRIQVTHGKMTENEIKQHLVLNEFGH
jgi:hypothetical protein